MLARTKLTRRCEWCYYYRVEHLDVTNGQQLCVRQIVKYRKLRKNTFILYVQIITHRTNKTPSVITIQITLLVIIKSL